MWVDYARSLDAGIEVRDPVLPGQLAEAERALGCRIPAKLASLLLETDGISGRHGLPVVWNLKAMVEENKALRGTAEFRDLYMPFEPILFFGGGPGGDLFGFVRIPERDHEVFVWDHETDGRWLVSYGLKDYLQKSLAGPGGDWFRGLR
ncbi:SMI1/KNR4 family protein [Kitasatospora indigofera]|uniref:SMI1/KNR4 family protein n=2 Tax=Kitasatospora indigofera TaxID=67307 RepID=UPI003684F004